MKRLAAILMTVALVFPAGYPLAAVSSASAPAFDDPGALRQIQYNDQWRQQQYRQQQLQQQQYQQQQQQQLRQQQMQQRQQQRQQQIRQQQEQQRQQQLQAEQRRQLQQQQLQQQQRQQQGQQQQKQPQYQQQQVRPFAQPGQRQWAQPGQPLLKPTFAQRPFPPSLFTRPRNVFVQTQPIARSLALSGRVGASPSTQRLDRSPKAAALRTVPAIRQQGMTQTASRYASVAKPLQPAPAFRQAALLGSVARGGIATYVPKPSVAGPLKTISGTRCAVFGWNDSGPPSEPASPSSATRFPPGSYQVASLGAEISADVVVDPLPLAIPSEDRILIASLGCGPPSATPTRQFNRASLVTDTVRGAIALGRLDRVNQAHAVSRHGPGTTLESQRIRAEKGLTPDGVQNLPVNATRFLTYRDQARAYRSAMLIWRSRGMPSNMSFNFKAGPNAVAEGYYMGGAKYSQTNEVKVVFRNGVLYTIFGLLK
jgi:hypothetical protein